MSPRIEVGADVLVQARVDLVAMAQRRQVAAVGGTEMDARRHRLAGRRIDDLDLEPAGRARQRLDREARRIVATVRRPGAAAPERRSSSITSVASGAMATSTNAAEVAARSWPSRALPQPAIESAGQPSAATGAGAARSRMTWPRSTDRWRLVARWRSTRSVRLGSRRSGESVPRKSVMAATTTALPSTSGASGSIRRRARSAGPPGTSISYSQSAMSSVGLGTCRLRRSAPGPTRRGGSPAGRPAPAPRSEAVPGRDTDRASRAARRTGADGQRTHPAPSR